MELLVLYRSREKELENKVAELVRFAKEVLREFLD
jgi:hypothetical protein